MKETPNWPKDLDIIIMPLSRWDGDYSSTIFSLAKEFSNAARVFYFDNPYTLKDVIVGRNKEDVLRRKKSWKENEEWLSEISHNLYHVSVPIVLPINFLKVGKLYNRLGNRNNTLVANRLSQLLQSQKITNYIFINSFNPFYPLKFPADNYPRLKVYHCMDAMGASAYIGKHGADLENKLISDYDVTITTSKALYRDKKEIAKAIYTIPNAADIELFSKSSNADSEAELAQVKQPMVMYVGNIDHRIDYDLLKHAIVTKPNLAFVFIGPFGSDGYKEAGIDTLSNVHFLGKKKLEAVPALLSAAACTIIPFKRNDLTAGIYPLKINEYLSLGKPVVSTRFSEDIQEFEPCIALENEKEAFADAIESAIKNDTKEQYGKRKEFVAANNWTNRSREFLNIILKHLG